MPTKIPVSPEIHPAMSNLIIDDLEDPTLSLTEAMYIREKMKAFAMHTIKMIKAQGGRVGTFPIEISEEQMHKILYGTPWPGYPDNAD